MDKMVNKVGIVDTVFDLPVMTLILLRALKWRNNMRDGRHVMAYELAKRERVNNDVNNVIGNDKSWLARWVRKRMQKWVEVANRMYVNGILFYGSMPNDDDNKGD